MMERPTDFEALRALIAERHVTLSRQLRQIAAFVIDRPNDVALETIAVIAARVGVQPSSLIRFAKQFGFNGFSEMQRLFRSQLVARVPDYDARIAQLGQRFGEGAPPPPGAALAEFIDNGVAALENLGRTIDDAGLERAVAVIAQARAIHVAGFRRSFPVAAYLAYGFGKLGLKARLLDGTGGMLDVQGEAMTKGDALLVVSFPDYAPEAVGLAEQAGARGVKLVAITDGPLSPIAGLADALLEVHEVEFANFRSLVAQMCLSLSLVVSVGQRLGRQTTPRRASARAAPGKSRR